MILTIHPSLHLELIEGKHAQTIYELANSNRQHLREWLPWVDYMDSVEFIQHYIQSVETKHKLGFEFGFVIFENNQLAGRITVHKIDMQNKIGEIGYWLGKEYEMKGIMTQACKRLMEFCFMELQLNRLEIKCAFQNVKSQAIPKRLHYTFEGILHEAEFLHGKFMDLNLYAFLKKDWVE